MRISRISRISLSLLLLGAACAFYMIAFVGDPGDAPGTFSRRTMVSALLAATVVLGVAGIHITSTVAPQIFCSRAGRERVGAGIIVLFCSGFYIYASVSRMVTANLVLLLSAVLGVLFFLEILLRMTIRICYRGAA